MMDGNIVEQHLSIVLAKLLDILLSSHFGLDCNL